MDESSGADIVALRVESIAVWREVCARAVCGGYLARANRVQQKSRLHVRAELGDDHAAVDRNDGMDRPRPGTDLDRVGSDLNVLANETVDEMKLMMGVTSTCSVG